MAEAKDNSVQSKAGTESVNKTTTKKAVKSTASTKEFPKVEIPELKDLLKAGVQFGHETKRWNPKMAKYIFGAKNNIHIIDITQTLESLEKAVKQLQRLASQGDIMYVGTKRQASDLVKKYAIESGGYFVAQRWVGGFFTNFKQVKLSTRRLRDLEAQFTNGVEGRTKYEISRMKVEWQRLDRLYQGVKNMERWPVAVVVIDPRFERGAIKECAKAGIPVFALGDTNCDPDGIDYLIPGNDDALGSIDLIIGTLAQAVKTGNGGKQVKHDLTDFSSIDIKVVKKEDKEIEAPEVVASSDDSSTKKRAKTTSEKKNPTSPKKSTKKSTKKSSRSGQLEGGILGRSRQSKK